MSSATSGSCTGSRRYEGHSQRALLLLPVGGALAAAAWDLAVMVVGTCVPVSRGAWGCMGGGAQPSPHQGPSTLLVRARHTGMYTKKTVGTCACISPISTHGRHAPPMGERKHARIDAMLLCDTTLPMYATERYTTGTSQLAPLPTCRCQWIWSGGMTCPSTSTSAFRPSPARCSGETVRLRTC